MKIGPLRHRVVIQQKSVTRDTYGAEVVSWTNVATVWAAVEPLAGNERYVNTVDQRIAEATTRIRIRYRDGIDSLMRVVHTIGTYSHTYDIRAILNQWGRFKELHLMCKEVNPADS